MKTLFEKGAPGRATSYLAQLDVEAPVALADEQLRVRELRLPQMAEHEVDRHYSALERRTHGVNNGAYLLGSCTMKYNPLLNEVAANQEGFSGLHPMQPASTTQGALAALVMLEEKLSEVCGMDAMSFQAVAGAQGELTGLLIVRAYHQLNGEDQRTEVIIPAAAHGTNPASATMAGYSVIKVACTPEGGIDLDDLRRVAGDKTAAIMLTNPDTEGVFERQIAQVTQIVHEAGGQCYYDGANLNAIMGIVRPGDMGFDVVHLNLHKTMSTPHGGGGPGSGGVGVKEHLKPFLPGPHPVKTPDGPLLYGWHTPEHSIGRMHAFTGNFLVTMRALTYVLSLGANGLLEASQMAVLNANYLKSLVEKVYTGAHDGLCMHEFVLTLTNLKESCGISAMDIAKGMLDHGIHPPTMYFPLTVPEALMVEPTETETKETLEEIARVFTELHKLAHDNPDELHHAPRTTPVSRLDEVGAARNPQLTFDFDTLSH